MGRASRDFSDRCSDFLIVSGFLITGSFFKNGGNLYRYFVSRALRIYPGLWANLLVIAVMLVAFGVLKFQTIASVPFGVFSLAMLATGSITLSDRIQPVAFYWNDAIKFFPGGALWTIVLELGFYLMVPIIFLPFIRKQRHLAILAITAAGVASYLFAISIESPTSLWFIASPFPHFWIFAIGALANLCWPQIAWMFRGTFPLWLTVYVGARYFTGDQAGPAFYHPSALATALMFLLAGCVLSFAFSFQGLSKALRGHDISYGVYLHHMPILMLLLACGQHGPAAAAVLIPATVCAGIVSWLAIERPALALKSRIDQLPKKQVAASQLV